MGNPEIPPVLLLVYKRPETTQRVFDAIRAVKPKILFVGADGPKDGRPDDLPRIAAVRQIVQNVDWDCQTHFLFQDRNVGSKVAETTAITRFFEQVEEGIILEEDCLPDVSFFAYCAELLERYRHDSRVMHISGSNFMFGRKVGDASYYFSQFPICWGWASWRRAWQLHDSEMNSYPAFAAQKQIDNLIADRHIRSQYLKFFGLNYKNGDAWDYPWIYTIVSNRGLCILPNVNLVTNIGFGADATTCANANSIVADVRSGSIAKLTHPRFLVNQVAADQAVFYRFHPPWYLHFVAEFVRIVFPRRLYEGCVGVYLWAQRRLCRRAHHAG